MFPAQATQFRTIINFLIKKLFDLKKVIMHNFLIFFCVTLTGYTLLKLSWVLQQKSSMFKSTPEVTFYGLLAVLAAIVPNQVDSVYASFYSSQI